MTASKTETEGVGVVAAIVLVVAGLTALRYAPWILASAVMAIVIALLTPREIAVKAAVCALAIATIAAPLAAIAVANDYDHTATRTLATPARGAPRRAVTPRRPGEASVDTSRKGAQRSPAAGSRLTDRAGFLPAWNPSQGLFGPFHPAALKRWWPLTASVTTALTALLSAALLAASAIYRRHHSAPSRHASWPRIGHSSRGFASGAPIEFVPGEARD